MWALNAVWAITTHYFTLPTPELADVGFKRSVNPIGWAWRNEYREMRLVRRESGIVDKKISAARP